MLDNIADLVLTVGLLTGIFGFPADFAFRYMIPGSALGVLVGDILFTVLALRLARRTGRGDVTAMPLGLDTPSTLGMVIFVLGPAFLAGKKSGLDEFSAATEAWQIGICSILWSGLFKIACAPACNWIRRSLPRAGLLGSLAAIALVLISFLPLLEIFHTPIVGLVALTIILTTLVARVPFPGRIPGALAALLIGSLLYYCLAWTGRLGHETVELAFDPNAALLPTGWLSAFSFGWIHSIHASLAYLPIVIPLALATVIGGIDCTESAAAAGDDYDTRQVVAIEGFATIVAALCGGVVQTTPYIGHPAYKAMGGRAAYTLATALFIGGAGVLGYFAWIYKIVPQPAVLPILIFVGIEITSQSFHATPRKHFPAVALACVPALAALVMIYANQLLDITGTTLDSLPAKFAAELQTMQVISSGFIVTSLLWASWLAALIDRRLLLASGYAAIAALCSLFGVIHSPLRSSPLMLPWDPHPFPTVAAGLTPVYVATAYASVAIMLVAWGAWESTMDSNCES